MEREGAEGTRGGLQRSGFELRAVFRRRRNCHRSGRCHRGVRSDTKDAVRVRGTAWSMPVSHLDQRRQEQKSDAPQPEI